MYEQIKTIYDSLINDSEQFIFKSDKTYTDSIDRIVKQAALTCHTSPIILISGPSGSGKTTTAHKIKNALEKAGIHSHPLSIDNYFYPMNEKEKALHEKGALDLESPDRVDRELLNRQLRDIINCKPTYLPVFDFKTNTRSYMTAPLIRRENEVIIVEGTHALNPSVITLPDDKTLRVYVSVRTRVMTPSGELIHPEYIRLLRRMLRDNLFRGRTFTKTAKMYESVQKGENDHIMPYKYRSSFDVDTFIAYELSVYKDLIYDGLAKEDMLHKVPELIRLLQDVFPLSKDVVPNDSLIREFLGK